MEFAKKSGCEKKTRAPRTLYFKLKAWSVYSILSMAADVSVQMIEKRKTRKKNT